MHYAFYLYFAGIGLHFFLYLFTIKKKHTNQKYSFKKQTIIQILTFFMFVVRLIASLTGKRFYRIYISLFSKFKFSICKN